MTDKAGSRYKDHCEAVALGSVDSDGNNIFTTCEYYLLI